MPPEDGNGQRHVVVVGGGFAGVGAAQRLAKQEDVQVTLLDRNNYHQFQPLLYQVATCQLAPADIAYSLRRLFRDQPNVDVKLEEVAGIDPATRTVTTADGREYRGDAHRAGGRLAAELLPHPGRGGATRSRSTRSTTRRGCARRSSASSRPPIATPP